MAFGQHILLHSEGTVKFAPWLVGCKAALRPRAAGKQRNGGGLCRNLQAGLYRLQRLPRCSNGFEKRLRVDRRLQRERPTQRLADALAKRVNPPVTNSRASGFVGGKLRNHPYNHHN